MKFIVFADSMPWEEAEISRLVAECLPPVEPVIRRQTMSGRSSQRPVRAERNLHFCLTTGLPICITYKYVEG